MKNIIYFIKGLFWDIKAFFINLWRISPEKAERNIINRMLRKHNVDIQHVINNPEIEGIQWYQYYTFDSKKEYEKWRKYSLKQFKRAYPYSTLEYNEKRLNWIDFQYGLKKNYLKD